MENLMENYNTETLMNIVNDLALDVTGFSENKIKILNAKIKNNSEILTEFLNNVLKSHAENKYCNDTYFLFRIAENLNLDISENLMEYMKIKDTYTKSSDFAVIKLSFQVSNNILVPILQFNFGIVTLFTVSLENSELIYNQWLDKTQEQLYFNLAIMETSSLNEICKQKIQFYSGGVLH